MQRKLGQYAPQLFAILRIIAGLMWAMHGTQKLFGWPSGKSPATAPLMITAGVIEVVGGLLIAIGFLTSWMAFLASGTMAVAYFKSHADPIFSWPIVNRGELAVLYCFLFLYIAAHGAGVWSVDAARKRR
jgi:putative oxidoreductase